MRRAKGLWPRLVSLDNLYRSFRQCRRGKRRKTEVALFERDLESHLLAIQEALLAKTWRPGPYRAFEVTDTKPRKIVAAPFADRVVHTALVRVLEPVLERTFIDDTYACRPGKGTHAALERLGRFLRRPGAKYALKGDISRFFASIDHQRLRELLARRIADRDVLWLADRILESHRTPPEEAPIFAADDMFVRYERACGLPIGNLTSQLWSTLALDPMDRFVKHELRAPMYVRYADDFVILDPSKERLHEIRREIQGFLAAERLRLEPRKCRVFPARLGVDFLGFVCHPGYRELRKASALRFAKRLRALQKMYARGDLEVADVTKRIRSWIAHASFGKTWGLRRSLLLRANFVKGRRREGKKG